jgi:RHS repeat-associated protein
MKRIPSVALGRDLLVIAGLALASAVGNLSAADTYYVSDHLATTTAVADAAGEIASLEADAFGSPVSGGEQAARYTGKPYDADMGAYVFPFRNYRSDEARWMSADPSGFPDGMNAGTYAPLPFIEIDPLGLAAWTTRDFITHFYNGNGAAVTLSQIGYLDGVKDNYFNQEGVGERLPGQIENEARGKAPSTGAFSYSFSKSYDFEDVKYELGSGVVGGKYNGNLSGDSTSGYKYSGTANFTYSDSFTDPLDIIQATYGSSTSPNAPQWLRNFANLGGTAFSISGSWSESYSGHFE